MAEITEVPAAGGGVGRGVVYRVSGCAADEATEVEVSGRTDTDEGSVLGVKVLYGETEYRVDVAGYVRGLFAAEPRYRAQTGWAECTGYAVWVRIRVGEAVSEWCPLLAGTRDAGAGGLLSGGPRVRRLAPGEWDECVWRKGAERVAARLRLRGKGVDDCVLEAGSRTDGGAAVLLAVNRDDVAARAAAAGRKMEEFAWLDVEMAEGAETEEGAGADGMAVVRRYRLERRRPEGVRLGWVNEFGGMDYYTFAGCVREELRIGKERAATAAGVRVTSSRAVRSMTLVSRCQTPEGMRWLASLAGARRVWMLLGTGQCPAAPEDWGGGTAGEGGVRIVPVDVSAGRAVLRQEGALCRLELEVTAQEEIGF